MKYSKEYAEAKKRVKKRKGFYSHLGSYISVNLFLIIMNDFEPVFPVIFWWGVGLVSHYIGVFGLPGSGALSDDWEKREIEKEMARMSEKEKMLPPTNRSAIERPEMQKRWSEEDLV